MAKKASTKRVHQIAKELGVTSKDVVSKCEMEGIPSVTNHMSTLSVGLAATIRDWFNETGDAKVGTSVQTAAPVDVSKARAKAKKKVRKKPAAKAVAPAPKDDVVASPDDAPPTPEAPVSDVSSPPAEPVSDAPTDAPPEAPATDAASEEPPAPPRGRKLEQPVKTKLAGPKVIRVETPDVLPKPRAARSS